jgi:hypothetical protein
VTAVAFTGARPFPLLEGSGFFLLLLCVEEFDSAVRAWRSGGGAAFDLEGGPLFSKILWLLLAPRERGAPSVASLPGAGRASNPLN